MRRQLCGWTAALLLFAPPALGQQDGVLQVLPQVTRDVFTYTLSGSITVDVLAEAPGVLRLMRGRAGRIEVTARAQGGLAGSGLAGSEGNELKLTELGAEQVEYLVIVPEEVRVRVRLPDRYASEVFGTLQDMGTYAWGTERPAPAVPGRPVPGARPAPVERSTPPRSAPVRGLHTAYGSSVTPRIVAIPAGAAVRTVTVRWQGDRFHVATSRLLGLSPGDPTALVIRPSGEPIEIVISVPSGTDEFVLRVGGAPALVLLNGRGIALCQPVIEQRLDGGRRWYTFTPTDGRLQCRGDGRNAIRRSSG